MQEHIVTYLYFLQHDIKTLVRTKQDDEKLCELRTKRDLILNGVALAVKSKPENYRNMEVSR